MSTDTELFRYQHGRYGKLYTSHELDPEMAADDVIEQMIADGNTPKPVSLAHDAIKRRFFKQLIKRSK